MPHLVLASASPARLATLRSAGVAPSVQVSEVDEDQVLAEATSRYGTLEPVDAVLVLARAKAEDVADLLTESGIAPTRESPADDVSADSTPASTPAIADALVVGCDSMLELDGEAFGKPRDAAEARARWQSMRGRSGTLHTGHWMVDLRESGHGGTGATLGATSSTVVHFAQLSDTEIDAYVATGEPLGVAGAFTIDGLGGAYVERIEGDHHGVVGLSLPLLRELLGEVDVPWHSLRVVEG